MGFKVGDLVEITTEDNAEFYFKGDRCVLTDYDGQDWWAEFDKQGNKEVYYSAKGNSEWCIGQYPDFRLVGGDK